MKKIVCFILAMLLCVSALADTYTVKTIIRTSEIVIEDEWFTASSYEYNHKLMRSMLEISMTGLGTSYNYGLTGDFDRESSSRQAAAQLELEGFEAHNYDISLNDASSYSAYYLGYRTLSDESVLLFCVARCHDYGCGFANNFLVSDSGVHEGFYAAGAEMAAGVADYIAAHLNGKQVRVAVTGYSRAAAVANVAAKLLDDMASEGKIPLVPENIYAYGFAVPTTVIEGRADEGSSLYDNIYSIVNYLDIVPEAPMAGWGFTRYGRTFTFARSAEVPAQVSAAYKNLTGKELDISGKRDKIENVLNSLLSKVPTIEEYAAKMQPLFTGYISTVYARVNKDSVDSALITEVMDKYADTSWGRYILSKYDRLTDAWVSDPVLALLMNEGHDGLEAIRQSAAAASVAGGTGDELYASLLSFLAVSRLTAKAVSPVVHTPEILLRAEYLPMLTVFAGFMECFSGHDFSFYIAYLSVLSEEEAFG